MKQKDELLELAFTRANTNKLITESCFKKLKVGLDLGTAFIKFLVLNENNQPLLSFVERANVVRDGVVADFFGAVQISRKMISDSIKLLNNCDFTSISVGYPPNTDPRYVTNVVNSVGYDVDKVIDEPTAAAKFLNVDNGVVVDIGGGTTGIAIIRNGKVVRSFDEPTGGHHLTLVLAGNKKIKYEEAEHLKISDVEGEYLSIFKPVIEKMAYIVKNYIKRFRNINEIYLVGGPTSYPGFAEIFESELNKKVFYYNYPILITTYGITI